MSGPGQTNEEGNTMNDDTDPKTCSEHGDVLIWEPGGDDMPTVYGRWYCPSCQRRLMAALDASRARGIKQGRDEQPTVSAGDVERVAERLHAEHVREFEWMKGDRLFDEVKASECGNCQRWGRYAATLLADVRREERERVLGEVERKVEAWIRHGQAVPADVTTYDRWIVHEELRDILREARGGAR